MIPPTTPKKEDARLFVAVFSSEAVSARLTVHVCASVSAYDPGPLLAVFYTQLMMGLLYTKYICEGP